MPIRALPATRAAVRLSRGRRRGRSRAWHQATSSTEQTEDARGKRPAIGSHGESRCLPPLFHEGEGASVLERIAAKRDSSVIATMFALEADAMVEPPNGGVVEKQGLDCDLKEVYEGIKAYLSRPVRGRLPTGVGLRRGQSERSRAIGRWGAGKHSGLPLLGDARVVLEQLSAALGDHRVDGAWERRARSEALAWGAEVARLGRPGEPGGWGSPVPGGDHRRDQRRRRRDAV